MKKALSLPEVLIVIAIIITLTALARPVVSYFFDESNDKIYAIKANNTLKEVINGLLNNSEYYSSKQQNFAYNIDTLTKQEKFKKSFEDSFNNKKENIDCYIVSPREGTPKLIKSYCILTNDNIAWGMPPYTDFYDIGVVKITNKYGKQVSYLPITVYPNFSENKVKSEGEKYFYYNAIVYGVRYDGEIIFLNDDDIINKADYGDSSLHYQAQEYISKQ